MSRTRSQNSVMRMLRAMLVLSIGTVVTGCGVNVHSSSIRGTAYVRLSDAVKKHPLYSQLTQVDDAIAAISLESSAPHVPLAAKDISAQTAVLNRELRAAQDRANKIISAKQHDYSAREQQAVAAALSAAGVPGAGAFAASQMSGASASGAQEAAQAANADFQSYQRSVVAQDNAAAGAIASQLQTQASQKYRAKAEQLQQNETDLSLRLTQQDASARLAIKMRLSNLAMDPAARKQAQAQLAAIDAKEGAQVTAMRNADNATLRAYHARLDRETSSAISTQTGAIASQTRAKLEDHRNQVGAQLRSLAPAPPAQNLTPSVRAQIADIQKKYAAQFQTDAAKTMGQYQATKSDLDRQFAALHGADVGATGAAATELQSLQKRRNDLYNDIVASVERDANRIAKDKGFDIVFVNILAAGGGYDLTNQVISDIESQHE
jgi:hypothetical protein